MQISLLLQGLIAGCHLPNFASRCAWEGHQHQSAPNSPLAEPAIFDNFFSLVIIIAYITFPDVIGDLGELNPIAPAPTKNVSLEGHEPDYAYLHSQAGN